MEVSEVVARARAAQLVIADWDADRVHELTTAVAYAVARKDRAEELARLAVDETGFGNFEDKVIKIERRVLGVLADLRQTPTVGVVEEDPARGLVKIAKPVGVRCRRSASGHCAFSVTEARHLQDLTRVLAKGVLGSFVATDVHHDLL